MSLLSLFISFLLGPLVILLLALFRLYSTLSHVSGPFLAAFTNFPRLYWVWGNHSHEKIVALHRKYGKLVRVGPNMVSVADAAEIQHIYAFNDTFKKSDFYSVILPYNNGKAMPGMISTNDNNIHRMLKRPVANVYSMTNLVSFESLVDSTIRVFCDTLDRKFAEPASAACDLSFWLQAFVFDTLGELTFSKRYGFIENGRDVDNIMTDIWQHFRRVSLVGQVPWIDTFLRINPLLSKLRPQPVSPIVKFTMARLQERKVAGKLNDAIDDRDLLSRFLVAQATTPGLPPFALFAWIAGNITAGSDTTAIILRTVFYFLLKNPSTLQTLSEEILSATKESRISEPPTWKEIQTLPYLDACIKEAQRIHAPIGLHLERVVPEGGSTISGTYLKAGTIVGINAWAIHNDTEIFGEDVAQWRPERWLDCNAEQQVQMEKALFAFGAGTRVCIGKNFALLIIYKLVPSLLQRFNMSLVDADVNWRVENRWFVVQRDIQVRLEKRSS